MKTLRPILLLLGLALALMGMLWIGQGLGYVHWPRSSPMRARTQWADYGSALAVAGLILLLVARRLPRR